MLPTNEGSNITDNKFKKANVCFLRARVFKNVVSKSEQCLFCQISDNLLPKGLVY